MLYRAWIAGRWHVTPVLTDLDACDSVDIFIRGIWQVWR